MPFAVCFAVCRKNIWMQLRALCGHFARQLRLPLLQSSSGRWFLVANTVNFVVPVYFSLPLFFITHLARSAMSSAESSLLVMQSLAISLRNEMDEALERRQGRRKLWKLLHAILTHRCRVRYLSQMEYSERKKSAWNNRDRYLTFPAIDFYSRVHQESRREGRELTVSFLFDNRDDWSIIYPSVVWSRAQRLLVQPCARVTREISAWGNRNAALVMSCRKVCLSDDQTSNDYGDVVWFPISFITMIEQADATKSIRARYWRPHFRAIVAQRCWDTKISFRIAYSASPRHHPCHRPARDLSIYCGVVQVSFETFI